MEFESVRGGGRVMHLFMMYVRVTRSEEEDRVSRALSSNAAAGGIQPGYYYNRGKSSGEGAE